MNRGLVLVSLVIVVASGISEAGAATVVRGPYLQSATPERMIVRWRTAQPTNSRVVFGADPNDLSLQAGDANITNEHTVELTGLSADTRYYYGVGTQQGILASGLDYSFITPPAAPRATRIWVVGDSGTASPMSRAVRDGYSMFARGRYADLWLMLGDNAYPSGSDASYQAAVFETYPELLRQTVLWPTIGNHDLDPAYFGIFNLPTAGECGGVPSGTESYYSFNYANIHFVCLNSHNESRLTNGPMLTWLQEDLEATTKEWIIAFWHHPPYSKGSHDSDFELELVEMRQHALPILEAHGVDLVLCGHSHSYERSYLLNGHYGTSGTLRLPMLRDRGNGREDGSGAYMKSPPETPGTVYAVAGSSGQISVGGFNHPAMLISLYRLGSMVLDIESNRLNAIFLRETAEVDDYFTIAKGPQPEAPFIVHQPLSRTVTIGSSVKSSVIAGGAETLAFQWYHDGVAIEGANRSSLAHSSVMESSTGDYSVVIANAFGTVTSAVARLTVVPEPLTILSQPRNASAYLGQEVTFTVNATGTPPLSYQWRREGTNIPGATSSNLFFSAVATNDGGGYSVVVSHPYGTLTSVVATLTLFVSSPTIYFNPASQTVCPGADVAFAVTAYSVPEPTYQWLRDGTNIPGATSFWLRLPAVNAAHAGGYSVLVMNTFGALTSTVATLTILTDPPAITEESADQETREGEPASFSVTASSPCVPISSYQWRFNDVDIPGATERDLFIETALHGQAGGYTVVVSNSFGSVASRVMLLTVLPPWPPSFEWPPASQTVGAGTDVTLQTEAYPALLSFQWLLNEEPIPGVTNNLLLIANANTNHTGIYKLVASNISGIATSQAALVIVKPPSPLDRWKWRQPIPQGNDLASITFGNGTFVAVGAKGTLLSSRDGVKWQVRSQGVGHFSQVAFGRGLFVAVGQYGAIVTSPDGVTWTRQVPAPNSVTSIVYGNGVFAASLATRLPPTPIPEVSGERLSAASLGHQRIALASDGTHWSFHAVGLGHDLTRLASGASQFLALVDRFRYRDEDDATVSTLGWSTNGTFWLQGWMIEAGEFHHLRFAHDRFLAFEQGYPGGVPRIITSPDGSQWSLATLSSSGGVPTGVAYGNGVFVGAGHDYNPADAAVVESVFSSSNGLVWIAQPNGAAGMLSDVTFGNGQFVAVGNYGSILVSTNGTGWTRVGPTNAGAIRSVAHGCRTYVAVGDDGLMLKSTDGSTWTPLSPITSRDLLAITFAADRFVAVGGDILTSDNGCDWTDSTPVGLPTLRAVTHGSGLFVAVGDGTLVTSSNGTSWTAPAGQLFELNAIVYGMNRFIAAGCAGRIVTSPDGVSWTVSNTDECFRGIAIGSNRVVGVGPNGRVMTSPDALNWTVQNLYPYDDLETVTYAAGRFIAAGVNGRLYSSADGNEWVRHETLAAATLRSLVFANGTLTVVGDNQTILESGYFPNAFLRVRPPFGSEGFQFSVSAEPGRPYLLQASSDLQHWTDLVSFSNLQELTVFLDGEAPFLRMRFYRVVAP